MNSKTTRQRLLASTIIFGALLAGVPAFAQESSTAPNNPGQQTPPAAEAAPAATAAQQRQAGAPDNGATSPAGQAPAAPLEQPNQTAPTPTTGTQVSGVVVTGSRIRRNEFTSAAPIQVITSEQSTLEGLADTAQILQQSSVAQSANQLNNFFSGFGVGNPGGYGANTISLRGLGAQRTLVIVNGRRLGPSGVSGTIGPVDLNTIPSSIIDHIEILKDGASAIYGSDAIAGVVNIITKKTLDGGNIDFYVNPGQRPGGEQYDLAASWGKTFDRGYITVGAELYRQDALHYGQRSYLDCAQDLAKDPNTGQYKDIIDPRTGQSQCFNYYTGALINAQTGRRYNLDPSSVRGANYGQNLNGLSRVNFVVHQPCNGIPAGSPLLVGNTAADANCPIDVAGTENLFSQQRQDNPIYLHSSAIDPVRRYSFNANGQFDINAHNSIYTELLFNRRQTANIAFRQFFPVVTGSNPYNPFNPASPYYSGADCPTRTNPAAGCLAEPIMPHQSTTSTEVNYWRAVLGVRGDLPDFAFFHNWNYDLYGQYSKSDGKYTFDTILGDRVNATAAGGPSGCNPNAGQTSGSSFYSMNQLGDTATCVPVNYFTPAAINYGLFTPAETAFLFGTNTGHTTYEQDYVEGSLSGDLFTLPAGPLGAAIGFQLRHEALNDNPGPQDLARPANWQPGQPIGNLWGYTVTDVTKGTDDIKEVFGELSIPILKGLPLVENLSADVSGRYSDYRSYGSSGTYGLSFNYQVVPWFRVRGTYNTGFRAPQLFELYLGNQSSFTPQASLDPCILWGQSNNSALQKNCAAAGLAPTWPGGTVTGTVYTAGGKGILKAETSYSDTIGFVFTPKWYNLNLSVAVDYYNTKVKNQVQQFGAGNIVTSCYTSPNYPNDPFCSLFTRDNNPASPTYQSITVVNNDFVNVAEQVDEGLDLTTRFVHKLFDGINFTLNSQLSWTFYQHTELLNGVLSNTLGGTRYPGFNGNVDFRFDKGPWTLDYFVNMIGHTSDANIENLGVNNPNLLLPIPCPGTTNGTLCNGFHGTGTAAFFYYNQPFYAFQSISIRRRIQDITITLGIRNLFDRLPTLYSSGGNGRVGDTRLRSQGGNDYLVGRSFFLEVNKRF